MADLTFQVFRSFLVRAVLWGLTYYFIRRGLNPEHEDLDKFNNDAIYGSVAVFVSSVLFWYVDKVMNYVDT